MPTRAATLFQIVYTAVSAFDLTGYELAELERARSGRLNRLGLTGLLAFIPRTGEVFEALEGRREIVEEAVAAARREATWTAVAVHYEGLAERRQFGRWRLCTTGEEALRALKLQFDDFGGFAPPVRVIMELAAAHV